MMKINTTPHHRLISSVLVSLAGFVAAWRISPSAFGVFGGLYTTLLLIVLCNSWAMYHRGLGFIRALTHEVAPARVIFILAILVFPSFTSNAEMWVLSVLSLSLVAASVLCAFNDVIVTLDFVLIKRTVS